MNQLPVSKPCSRTLPALLLLILLHGSTRITPAQAHPADLPPASPVKTVPFMQGVHGPLLADLYLPTAPGLRPAIVFLHGGAWKHGDRTQLQRIATALAAAGYVGMAIDYDTTSRGDRFPVALREAEHAIQWLRRHAARYSVDPRRVAVAGSSAGGELAALIGLAPSLPTASQVQAVVVFNGVLDLSYVGPDAEDMIAPYLGGTCQAQPEPCRQASPIRMVRSTAPPFFVGHGTDDRIVPFTQAQQFVSRLQQERIPVTPFIATGAGHTYWNDNAWYQLNLDAVLGFLGSVMPAPSQGFPVNPPKPPSISFQKK